MKDLTTWSFFSNHAHVLFALAIDPDARLRDVAETVGITERAVQRIVHDLERDDHIAIERVGRRNRYRIRRAMHLRHAVEAHLTVGNLVDLLVKRKK